MDRASTQTDPAVAKLIRKRFVLVAGDRWYHTRQKDDVGRFVLKLNEQAQRIRPGKRIQQGLYCFRADGHLLSHRNHNHRRNLQSLREALAQWEKLPAETRKPGAIKIEEKSRADRRYDRRPPEGGLIVNVFMRILEKDGDGWCVGASSMPGGAYSARDRMWVTNQEWKALVPANARRGDEIEIPPSLRQRILCFHLCDHTRGQAYAWRPNHIRSSEMRLTVMESSDTQHRLRLQGKALLASGSNPDVDKAPRGFDVAFLAFVEHDRARREVTRFDFVAIGEHWGEGRFNRGARPGRAPFGAAYELCPSDDPGRLVPPLGTTDMTAYFGRR